MSRWIDAGYDDEFAFVTEEMSEGEYQKAQSSWRVSLTRSVLIRPVLHNRPACRNLEAA